MAMAKGEKMENTEIKMLMKKTIETNFRMRNHGEGYTEFLEVYDIDGNEVLSKMWDKALDEVNLEFALDVNCWSMGETETFHVMKIRDGDWMKKRAEEFLIQRMPFSNCFHSYKLLCM